VKDQQAAAHAHGKTGNIEKTVPFSFEDVPEGDTQMVGEHIGHFDDQAIPVRLNGHAIV